MAKGDDARARNQIDYQKDIAQNSLGNMMSGFNEDTTEARGRFREAADTQKADYGNLMSRFNEFADTGGYSPEDIQNMRARAVSPTRAIYANAERNLGRQRSLQGGYSPGYGTLMGRIAREGSQALSDASTNTEAALAEMKQRGKLAGTQGLLSGYNATPGAAGVYGNMFNQQQGNLLQGQGLQNQLSLGTMQNQIQASQIPGKWENTVGRINDVFQIGKNIAGTSIPWGGGGGLQMPAGPSNSTLLGPRP